MVFSFNWDERDKRKTDKIKKQFELIESFCNKQLMASSENIITLKKHLSVQYMVAKNAQTTLEKIHKIKKQLGLK